MDGDTALQMFWCPEKTHQSDHSNEMFDFVVMQKLELLEISICQVNISNETKKIRQSSARFVFNLKA